MSDGSMSMMLKHWSPISRFHKFILKSSADKYVSPSLHKEYRTKLHKKTEIIQKKYQARARLPDAGQINCFTGLLEQSLADES